MSRLLSLCLLVSTACASAGGGASSESSSAATPAGAARIDATFDPSLDVNFALMTRTASGLFIRDLQTGSGSPVSFGDQLRVRYRVSLADGTIVDDVGPMDTPFEFRVGNNAVVDGWDEGVRGMRPGGRRQLVIPARLGYGMRAHGNIPGNSILVVVVELLSINR